MNIQLPFSDKQEGTTPAEFQIDKEASHKERTMDFQEEYYDEYEEEKPEEGTEQPDSDKKDSTPDKGQSSQQIRKHKRKAHSLSGAIFRSAEKQNKFFEDIDYSEDIQTKIRNYNTYLFSFFQNARQYLADNPTHTEERNNLRILIIIGSKIRINKKDFVINNEFLLIAMLLRHIFLYAYQIPKNNILITSSNQKNIDPHFKISPPTSPLKDSQTTEKEKSKDDKKENDEPELTEKELRGSEAYSMTHDISYGGAYITQAEDTEYRFATMEDINTIIKPFNRQFLKLLNTDENSNVLIFFLDHGEVGVFVKHDYQYFIEHFLEIKAKQFVVFNECCNSGSLIELIHMSEKLRSNFDGYSYTELEDIFKELLIIAKTIKQSKIKKPTDTNEPQNKQTPFSTQDQTIPSIPSIEIDIKSTIAEALSKYHLPKDRFNFDEIVEIVQKLSKFSVLYPIKPKQFLEFKEKSIIFCSAPYNISSMSLPIQYFHCRPRGLYPTISSRGTFYSSILIHCLLNPTADSHNPLKFAQEMQQSFQDMRSLYKNILVKQVKLEDSDIESINCNFTEIESNEIIERSKEDCKEIEKYFQVDYTKETTLFAQPGFVLPNFKDLIVPKKYWCVDERHITSDIFANLKYYQYNVSARKHKTKETEEENQTETEENPLLNDPDYIKYGPRPDVCDIIAFHLNFYKCLEDNLSKFNLSSKLDVNLSSKMPPQFKKETKIIFNNFRLLYINQYKDALNSKVIKRLYKLIKYNLECNFSDSSGSPSERDIFLHCCNLSLRTLTKVWKDVDFY